LSYFNLQIQNSNYTNATHDFKIDLTIDFKMSDDIVHINELYEASEKKMKTINEMLEKYMDKMKNFGKDNFEQKIIEKVPIQRPAPVKIEAPPQIKIEPPVKIEPPPPPVKIELSGKDFFIRDYGENTEIYAEFPGATALEVFNKNMPNIKFKTLVRERFKQKK
jgi:hypothetical protein